MRYTTVIDISENQAIYKNHNVRLVYLHLCLKSGYHDDDRDLVLISIRNLAIQVGLSVSAVRHALQQLLKAGLVRKQGSVLVVTKWVSDKPITPRSRNKKEQHLQAVAQEREKQSMMKEEELSRQRQERTLLRSRGKSSFMVYYEGLLAKARQGDLEAQQAVERHRKTYEQQCELMKKQQNDS